MKRYGNLDLQTRSKLRLRETDDGNFVGLRAPATLAADVDITMPGADASANDIVTSDGSNNLSFAKLVNANVDPAAAIALSKLAALANNFALQSNGSGVITVSAVTATELGYLSGVTSAIQTQLNGKLSLTGGTLTGTLNIDNAQELRLSEADANGSSYIGMKAAADVTTTVTYTLPEAPAVSGYVLSSLTDGTMSWVSNASVNSFKTDWATADTATFAITHGLGTKDVLVEVYDKATGDTILIDSITRTSTSVVTVVASTAPPAGSWRVLIMAV